MIAQKASSVILTSGFAAKSKRSGASVARTQRAGPAIASWASAWNAGDRVIALIPINIALTQKALMVHISVRTSTRMVGRCARVATSARTTARTASAGNAKRTSTAPRGSIAPTQAAANPLTTMDGLLAPGIKSAKISAFVGSAGLARSTATAVQAGIATLNIGAKTEKIINGVLAWVIGSVRAGGAVLLLRNPTSLCVREEEGDRAIENTLLCEDERFSFAWRPDVRSRRQGGHFKNSICEAYQTSVMIASHALSHGIRVSTLMRTQCSMCWSGPGPHSCNLQ